MSTKSEKEMTELIGRVSDSIDELADDTAIQALQTPLLARLSRRSRNAIYETGKWLGLVGAAGLAVAGAIGGEGERFVEAAGLLVLAVSNWVAKANLGE